jgi:hypothetical protein
MEKAAVKRLLAPLVNGVWSNSKYGALGPLRVTAIMRRHKVPNAQRKGDLFIAVHALRSDCAVMGFWVRSDEVCAVACTPNEVKIHGFTTDKLSVWTRVEAEQLPLL